MKSRSKVGNIQRSPSSPTGFGHSSLLATRVPSQQRTVPGALDVPAPPADAPASAPVSSAPCPWQVSCSWSIRPREHANASFDHAEADMPATRTRATRAISHPRLGRRGRAPSSVATGRSAAGGRTSYAAVGPAAADAGRRDVTGSDATSGPEADRAASTSALISFAEE